jgi:undecaprenyl-diphosphatase
VNRARAVALGAVQGAAEVVPVSSSAQLVLLPWLLGWDEPADRTTFAAALHAGSCLGICWALRHERPTRRELVLVAAASVPAAVAGLVAQGAVEQRLGRPSQLAALLAAAGGLMWWVDARAERRSGPSVGVDHPGPRLLSDTPGVSNSNRNLSKISSSGARAASRVSGRQAALAGLAQVTALVPGVSRSGATLTALRAAGVPLPVAERFSLLMSLPVTAGAAGLSLARARSAPAGALPGAGAAAVAGALAARHLRPARSLRGPALYRLGLAAVVARRLVRAGGQDKGAA